MCCLAYELFPHNTSVLQVALGATAAALVLAAAPAAQAANEVFVTAQVSRM